MVGFLGALRAGVIAVPLFSPDLPGHGDRLAAVLADCRPSLALATTANADLVRAAVGDTPVLVVDELWREQGPSYTAPALAAGDVAYLQYTSGSTRLPKGVRITHANVVVNARQAIAGFGAPKSTLVVSWLPLFHDMGLLFALGSSLVGGFPCLLMDPVAFLMKPVRWLRHLSHHPCTIAAAPNFAYDYAAKRVSDAERETLELSGVRCMINGAEPVDPATLAGFEAAFAPVGLRPGVLLPSYGLAEATVYVCGVLRPAGAVTTVFDADLLSRGQAREPVAGSTGRALVSVTHSVGQSVAVVDPQTGRLLPDGDIGEIWVCGPNVGDGYWTDDEATARVFGQTLLDPGDLPAGPWLRTGDLGVSYGGDLYVTGRIKDVMIIDGRNHYPQDIESTVESAHEVIARHRTAAFSVAAVGGEAVVAVAEVSRHWADTAWDPATVARALRSAVSQRHGVSLHDVVLLGPDQIPRTTSGKIARAAGRQQYLEGTLRPARVPA